MPTFVALSFSLLTAAMCETRRFTTTTANIAENDCSYAIVDGICYAPLNICITLNGSQSVKIHCDTTWNNVQKSAWTSNPLCEGTAEHTTAITTKEHSCIPSCVQHSVDLLKGFDPGPLLPDVSPATEPTLSPSISPTLSTSSPTLYTAAPTQSPLLCVATISGKYFFPTKAPTVKPTLSPTLASTKTTNMKSNSNTSNTVFVSPAIPIHAICLLINVVLFIALVYHLLIKTNQKSKTQIVWSVKLFVLLTFICNIAGTVSILILSTIMATNKWTQYMRELAVIPYYAVSVAYCGGKFTLECFYLFRVYIAFRKSTVYALSKPLCAILMCFMLIVSLVSCYMFLIDPKQFNMPYYGYILISCLETVLIMALLYLFLKRLLMLILRHKISATNDRKSSTNTTSIRPSSTSSSAHNTCISPDSMSIASLHTTNLSTKQMKWIFLITRCILLSSISMITTIVFGFFAFYFCQYQKTDIFIVYGLWSLDMTTNTVCLYLNFIFANVLYNRSCFCCHNLCQRMVEYVAKRLFKAPLSDMKNLEMSQKPERNADI